MTDSTVLVVDDDPEVREMMSAVLGSAGYQVMVASDVAQASKLVDNVLPNLVLLDWMLGETPGVSFARRLRASQRTMHVPIIMVTGREREADRISGLEAGADDYVTKPFFPRELLARIKAVMRRCSPQRTDMAVEIAGIRLDPAARRITADGQPIELGDLEFRMLRFFMTHPGRVFSRAQLLDEIWGDHVFVEERTVDVHIRRLRQSFEATGHDWLLETVRAVGYRFRSELPPPMFVPPAAIVNGVHLTS